MAYHTHEVEQASEYAKSAMSRIKLEKLVPAPSIYELWYVYYSAQNPDVKKELDTLIKNKEKITDEVCYELYERFLSENKQQDAVRSASDEINLTIKTIAGFVSEVKEATTDYNGKLGGASVEIEKLANTEELQAVLGGVLKETQEMIRKNEVLENQLKDSSQAMNELQKDLDTIRQEAMTDGLTGLSNRKSFDELIQRLTSESKNEKSPYCLLMMDIDHFKSFNDTYGHQVGDQVIRLVARTLNDGIKGKDMAARYGGEEFAILLPETPLESALKVAESLRKATESKEIVNRNTGKKLGKITMSVGVAEFNHQETPEDLIGRADKALYAAKQNGRNRVEQAA